MISEIFTNEAWKSISESGTLIYKGVDFLSKLAFLIALIGFLYQRRQNSRSNFISCTARYVKIQEMMLSNDDVARLHGEIYSNRVPGLKGVQAGQVGKELAICSIMFQLMEDVWQMHASRAKGDKDILVGWDDLFTTWMQTKTVFLNWQVLQSHFQRNFVTYVERRYIKNWRPTDEMAIH